MNDHFRVEHRNYRGRPESLPWAILRDGLVQKIAEGLGLKRLAKQYGMSPTGMRNVLRRLGLKTTRQEAEAAGNVARH